MDNSNENLYRNALYAAFGVFVLVMCAATTARAETVWSAHPANQVEQGRMQ